MKILSITPSHNDGVFDFESFADAGTYTPSKRWVDGENGFEGGSREPSDWEHTLRLVEFIYEKAPNTTSHLHLVNKGHLLLISEEINPDSQEVVRQWRLFRSIELNEILGGGYSATEEDAMNDGLSFAYKS